MPKIEKRLWLSKAQGLLPGDSDKIVHAGCGNRPSLFIKNDDDRYWCYCHRCRGDGFHLKQNPRIKQKLSSKTGWFPDKLIPIVQAVVDEPYNFRELFEKFEIAPYVSLLKYSKETKRVYFPDSSGSYLGLDATFQANARFYSPVRRNLAVSIQDTGGRLYITNNLATYLEAVHFGDSAILTMNKAADAATVSLVANHACTHRAILLKVSDLLRRDIAPFI